MRRWEFGDGGSAKFWEAGAAGSVVTVRYGRAGAQGRTQEKDCGSAEAAAAHLAKVIREKERKGYVSADAAADDTGAGPETSGAGDGAPDAGVAGDGGPAAAAAGAPDESAFVLSPSWRRQLRPRRGGVKRSLTPPAETAPEAWRKQLSSQLEDVRKVFAEPESDERLVEAAKAYIAGEADPLGAAVLAATTWIRRASYADDVVDAWVLLHGMPFAARAVVESFGVRFLSAQRWGQPRPAHVAELPDGAQQYALRNPREAANRMRALLARADEETYRETVTALAGHRGDARRRIAVSYLVPGEAGWVAECCAGPGLSGTEDHVVRAMLFESLSDPAQLRGLMESGGVNPLDGSVASVATVAEGVGTAVAPLVDEYLSRAYMGPDTMRAVSGTLAELPTDEAFGMLLARLEDKHARPALLDAARRYPVRAARMLAEYVLGPGRGSDLARQLLAGHVSAHRELVEARLAEFPQEAAALVRELLHPAGQVAGAGAGALPALLVSPPWERKRKAVKPKAVRGLAVTAQPRLVWLPGEQEKWAATPSHNREWCARWKLKLDPEAMASEVRQRPGSMAGLFADGPGEVVRPLLADWRPEGLWDGEAALRPVAARFGLDALPGILHAAASQPAASGPAVLPYLHLDVARLMADWLVRLKSASATARAWFARHGVDAAVLLVPDAVGPQGAARRKAEQALRLIAAAHGTGTVRGTAAAAYGAEAAGAVDELLSADPLENALPARMPEVPAWAEPVLLPQVLLAGGRAALPPAAVRHLVTVLALSKPGQLYGGVDMVREACDASSLAGFAWALFEQWRLAGMPSKESWALHALGWFGDDGTVRQLTPLLRSWPGEGAHHRAVEGLDVLAEIGTDVALLHLHGVSQRVKFKALKQRAKDKIAEVAAGLGLSGEQLADRLVPDFGLDAGGSTVVDYGSRRFTVGFDEQLRPYVLDEDGKRRKDLPKPGARDDAELAPAERKRFMTLKKDVRSVAADQVRRLEEAMVAGRSWPAKEFRELFVAHPLLWHLVRRLVWLCEPGDAAGAGAGTAFRVAEDRTFADVGDEEFALPDGASVRPAHPLHLGDDLAEWAELFADYEILQPFPQLGRPVHRLTGEEAAGWRLPRFEGITVPTTKLLGLERRGWQRGEPQDAGVECWISRRVAEKRWVIINPKEGIAVGAIDIFPEQPLDAVWLHDRSGEWMPPREGNSLSFAELDPVIVSEVLADLTELIGR